MQRAPTLLPAVAGEYVAGGIAERLEADASFSLAEASVSNAGDGGGLAISDAAEALAQAWAGAQEPGALWVPR